MTWSIVALDRATGAFGVAVATNVPDPIALASPLKPGPVSIEVSEHVFTAQPHLLGALAVRESAHAAGSEPAAAAQLGEGLRHRGGRNLGHLVDVADLMKPGSLNKFQHRVCAGSSDWCYR